MKGAGHDRDPEECDRRDRYRYRQELVSRRRPGWTWGSRASAEVVAWAGGSTACQYAGLPDRHGGLCRGASSEPPAQIAWPRCPADAGEIRPRLLEGTEERLPRREVPAHLDGEYLKVAIAVALKAVVATLLDESDPRCSA